MKTKQNAKTTANQEPADGKALETRGLKDPAGSRRHAERLANIEHAARNVIRQWDHGDLATAIRQLRHALNG